ncbi:S24 family peptidase [uncultured Subdoligranulum sp.]|uniref:S24 family peptidase n=1 Tax=uncultured Subdoligranulum sp. TaxID=512298 RepID=UPI002618DC3A|nr:S24 family peptidase [uncultured Subdoligranulum sp.]
MTQAIALAKALGYHEVSDLFYDSDEAQLNKLGLDRLEEYRSLLLRSPQFRETVQPVLRLLPVYLQPASAGTGQWLDDDLSEEMEVDDSVPASAEFGVRLAGDSMSPRFADGQIVWARKTETAENGEIVLCVLNDQGYCKKLHRDEHGVSLISLNPKYDPISITEVDEFWIMGCVVG